jgi:hypothetical protein
MIININNKYIINKNINKNIKVYKTTSDLGKDYTNFKSKELIQKCMLKCIFLYLII